MGKVASRQPWTRMGVHVGRRGRCSPGPAFQEGCAYEHAVPGDGSWQCLQHKTSSSCLPLHRNLLYLKFPGVTRGPIDHFHMGGTALTSCVGVFAKRNPSTNGLAGLEAARFAGQSWGGGSAAGRQKGRVGIIATLNTLGERANWNPRFVPNHDSHAKGKSRISLRKAKGLYTPGKKAAQDGAAGSVRTLEHGPAFPPSKQRLSSWVRGKEEMPFPLPPPSRNSPPILRRLSPVRPSSVSTLGSGNTARCPGVPVRLLLGSLFLPGTQPEFTAFPYFSGSVWGAEVCQKHRGWIAYTS